MKKKKSLPNNMIFWYNFACQFIVVLSIAYQKSKKCPACGPNLEMAAWTQKVAIFPSSGNPNCQFDTWIKSKCAVIKKSKISTRFWKLSKMWEKLKADLPVCMAASTSQPFYFFPFCPQFTLGDLTSIFPAFLIIFKI